MQISTLAKVIGEHSAVGLVGFLYGDEGQLELAEGLDSERLESAVNSEANMDMRLKKASALIATLKFTRTKVLATAQKVAASEGADSPNVKVYAAQLGDLDKTIASLQATIDLMTKGHENAKTIVNSIQTKVQANLVNDQLTLTKKALNDIMSEQVQFTQDMIHAMPSSSIGSTLRKNVETKVENASGFTSSKLEVLQRLMAQQADTSTPDNLDEAGTAALAEILGK